MSDRSYRRRLAVLVVLGLVLLAYGLARGWFPPAAPSESSLVPALAGADRIRVRTGGTCHRDVAAEQTLFEETDPARIAAVVRSIRIDPSDRSPPCPCCGELAIEFYRGGALVVTLGCHGRSLRWDGWRGDGALTPDGAAALRAWLRSRGVALVEGDR